MNLKCLFGHYFKKISFNIVDVYSENPNLKNPIQIYTNILYECSRCKKLKVIKLDGKWGKDGGEDKDDKDPPKNPVMSPDDYFESIER